jgi:hypothetical protein
MGLDHTSFPGLGLVHPEQKKTVYSGDKKVTEDRLRVQVEKITQHGT